MPASVIVPIRADFKDVVEMLLADHAERIEHFVLERLDYAFNERLDGSTTWGLLPMCFPTY